MVTNTEVINLIDAKLLRTACPERSLVELESWVKPIKDTCVKYDISTARRVGSFISQMAHESGLIPGREENLNYSAEGLAGTWPQRYATNPNAPQSVKKIPNAKAKLLSRKPEAIANDCYADRMGNGNVKSGDGWKFRGLGPPQLTGRANWTAFGKVLNLTPEKALDYARTIAGGVACFGWFWVSKEMNQLADTPGVEDETQRLNGGYNGLEDRRTRFNNIVDEIVKRLRAKKDTK